MTGHQKKIITKIIIVAAITILTGGLMYNIKDLTNRNEAMLAMHQIGQNLLRYRQQNRCLPSESYLNQISEGLQGNVRLGKVIYRAIWLSIDSKDDAVLAYAEKKYHSLFVSDGYVVLRLGGRVDWMKKDDFEKLLKSQQSPEEITAIGD